MSTCVEIKSTGRLENEIIRTTSPTKTSLSSASGLKIECPQEDEASTEYYKPNSIKGIKLTKRFPAHIERARRRCLTQLPCNMVRDAILPSHFSKMLSPVHSRHDCEYGLYAHEPTTPTKETILELLNASPKFFSNNESFAKPSFAKFNKLPDLLSEPAPAPNQLVELLSSNQGLSALKNPSKRRVRATYGVRLESIRVGMEPESSRKCHSQDEYQPPVREGVRLAPIAYARRL